MFNFKIFWYDRIGISRNRKEYSAVGIFRVKKSRRFTQILYLLRKSVSSAGERKTIIV
jgi:uncharacterized protein YcfL